jgi:hypothetical protein
VNAFATITYLLYIVFFESLVLGGSVYLIFWRHASAWWFVLAMILSGAAYSPAHWRKLWESPKPESKP